ncbi:MAG: 50S ribosomal protein L18 [Candidatus Yanofskybacteria bacterium RIFCSPHIGHO2_02_FULL_44_12b]|uniref:Large ribosomal subunit protein uL18 n=2 Tax=Candidatus Yanofskyibacteriota TaxID=1752733 RepID=A0A1F8GJF1_9BACT|nr:MAG: 50S ribosomal protein L18 [Candidatus Yanofskybacteria bacterium GW2011_GWA2_44_9]OGN04893.1 MAG: 50S ribosomal protein L18 [Candidatus Yanofskybacteria bacterium RIFCSPHIGHO2_01_FULL_44_24]OGN16091.1 MAG: 50S ribosomal protein L18 [Candidatus Yanofskybacteria bacterium RIFCSPHIGHO2_02_FULL_44_12b]OGN25130.1 MAG: 50S ribosomal protein L18 [Candidatus Yanofskybacteria bacterium RIFCSPLOWO2_01_FULL_44_22]
MRRHKRVRAKVAGTKARPRISVFKSNRNLLVQFIDDQTGKTILSIKGSVSKSNKAKGTKTEKASSIAKALSEKAKEMGIKEAVLDRGGSKYHGRIKALVEGLRAGGLKI